MYTKSRPQLLPEVDVIYMLNFSQCVLNKILAEKHVKLFEFSLYNLATRRNL